MLRTLALATPELVGQEVTLKGWVHARRNMGKIIFIDLRDSTGHVQIVFSPSEGDTYSIAKDLRNEFVIEVTGEVVLRTEKNINQDMRTGTIELQARRLSILNPSKTLPFAIDESHTINEELRLTYRYIDLRSKRMQKNLFLRHRIFHFIRNYLDQEGFIEIETPFITKGTPEGAREYIIPSRLHAGKFYVLPQSPQQFKQLLMVSGIEKYFQIARCFRDEDQRGDRQAEFTQLDMEMSFVQQDDIMELNERLFTELVKAVAPEKEVSSLTFPRLTYTDAIKIYGTDKPDLRKNKKNPNELAFAWVVDFPMFEKGEHGVIQAAHHPFCMPHPQDISKLESDPFTVRASSYDLVLNGYEISSGSIRIHQRDLQNRIFKVLGYQDSEIQEKFGHMLRAFEFGAPPHGGMAPGLDRIVMILCNEPNIREVIAFPKTGDARDLMMGAPSTVPLSSLHDVHIEPYDEKNQLPKGE